MVSEPTTTTGRESTNRIARFKNAKHIGIVYAFVGSLFLSSAMLMCKKVKNLTGPEVSFLRTIVMSVLTLLQCVVQNHRLWDYPGRKRLLIARGVCSTVGSSALFTSILLIPLPDASSVKYCSVILTPFLALCLLSERLSKLNIASGFVSLFGVFMIANPFNVFRLADRHDEPHMTTMMNQSQFFHQPNLTQNVSTSAIMRNLMVPEMSASARLTFGVSLAFITSICEACGYCLGKRLSKTVPKIAIVFNMSSYSILMTLPVCVLVRIYMWSKALSSMPAELQQIALVPLIDYIDVLFIVGAGFLSMMGHLCVVSALKLENAGLVSIVRASDIVFSHFFQNLFFKTQSNTLSMAGSSLIILSVLAVSSWKIRRSRAEEKETNVEDEEANVELRPNQQQQ